MRIAADELQAFLTDIFASAGCSGVEAERVARRLVGANLAGHDSHGVVRTQRYVQSLANGVQVADQTIEVLTDGPSFALVDGRFGMGQTVGEQAVQVGIDKARATGVAIVGLRHAGHLGRIGDWAEMAAAVGLISVHFVNVAHGLLVAPFGAAERRFGTNPVTIGVPAGDGPPLLLDFATSIVAEGKALVALNGGKPVPPGALLDAQGRPTDDPSVLYGEVAAGRVPDPRRGPGALRAMGDHKGSGLAFMCEILAGALTGSGTAEQAQFCNGMLSIYLDPQRLDVDRSFTASLLAFVDQVKSARPADGVDEVLVPGEPETRRRAERLVAGIDLPDDTWASILAAATDVGVPAPLL